ncbi:MAG TPA: rRNA pseudouridine synthase, partial [Firmicutes bacterium]|nr:rRNA pseudouridine synthase [Bacillota bacterium]
LAHKVMHPKFGLAKVYLVEVTGQITQEALRLLRNGVALEDGLTQPAIARVLAKSDSFTRLRLSLKEGRNRQIRRMCRKVGFPVRHLLRIQIGPLKLGELPSGSFRELTKEEISALQARLKNKA